MFKRVLMFLYLNWIGFIKIVKEQVYDRQRKLQDKGDFNNPTTGTIGIPGIFQLKQV